MRRGRTSRTRKKAFKRSYTQDIVPLESNVNHLLQWADYNGLDMRQCHFKLYIFPDTGRGIIAKLRFKKNSKIISVPKNLLITTHFIMKSYIGDVIKKCNLNGIKPVQLLCIFLMCEKYKGCLSFWHPYIDNLPRTYTTPAYWNNEEIANLPMWIRNEAEQQIQNIRTCFSDMTLLASKLTTTYPDLKPAITYSCFVWAWTTVNTRAVFMKQQPVSCLCRTTPDNMVLVPVLDFLNHSTRVEVKAGFNEENDCYEIHTVTPCKKHEQLFISYGPHDNTKLLLEYGFMVPDNPHNAVVFSSGDFSDLVEKEKISCKKEKLSIIHENLLHRNCICSLQAGISWNLQCAVKILALDSQDINQWRKILYDTCEEQHNLHKFTIMMRSLLMAKMQLIIIPNYKEPLNYHEEMITRLCAEQRQILEYCIGTLT